MKKYIFQFFISTVLLIMAISCNSSEKLPKDIIAEDKMQQIFIDVYLAETFIQDQRLPQDTAKIETKKLYDKILAKHKTSVKDYYKSLDYYTKHPDLYSKILQPVIDSLSAMEARY